MGFQKYLFWFANEHTDFRLQEISSITQNFGIILKWMQKPTRDPFWIVQLNSNEDAIKIASRSVTLRSIIKLWGTGKTVTQLHEEVKSFPIAGMTGYCKANLSFRMQVESFCKTYTMQEKVEKMEMFSYLPIKGNVKLNEPDVTFYYIEYFGLDSNTAPEEPHCLYFGPWLCDGQRELISRYSLKKRKFIGNTSMDSQLSFLTANQALIKPGDLVMDPFVGTGSLLVAAAYFGAYVMGTDIDYLMLHGKTRPSRKQDRLKTRAKDESVYSNLEQYETGNQYIDVVVGDSSLPFWHEKLKLDSILTDPPYGIREATERIGSTRDYKISDKHLQGHIPSKIEYSLTQIYSDLLKFAAKHLKLHGRLVSWIPVCKEGYEPDKLPSHPCFQLISNSEQPLRSHISRRLLTFEKVSEPTSDTDKPEVPELFSAAGFREHYFGHGETRKQRRSRLSQDLREKSLNSFEKDTKNSER